MEEEDHTVSRAKDQPGGQVQRMGEQLYDAFWRRQPGDVFPPFEGQAEAIRNMWFGIAGDALSLLADRAQPDLPPLAEGWEWVAAPISERWPVYDEAALSHQQPHDQIREGEGS